MIHPHDPARPLLGIYPKDKKIHVHIKICTEIFIAALKVVAENYKQPKCLSTSV